MPAFILAILKNPKVLFGIGIFVILAGVGGYVWWQKAAINRLNEKNSDLIVNLKIAIAREEAQKRALVELKTAAENNLKVLNEYGKRVKEIQSSVQENKKIFENHNLSNLAAKKPGLIESRVNKATIRVFKQIEDETKAFYEANQ